MTLEEIRTLLQQKTSQSNVLTVNAATLSSGKIGGFIGEYFSGGQFSITLTEDITIDGQTVVAKGASSLYGLTDASVEAKFRVFGTAAEPALNLRVKLPDNWKFTQSFPEWLKNNPTELVLPGEEPFVFDQLTFGQAILIFESDGESSGNNKLTSGINFNGVLSVTKPLDEVDWLLGGEKNIELWGTVKKEPDGTSMNLVSDFIHGITIGFLSMDTQLKLVVENIKESRKETYYPQANFNIITKLNFEADGKTEEIILTTRFSRIIGVLNFIADFDPIELADLQKLGTLVNGADLQVLPSEFELAKEIVFSDFSFALMPASQLFVSVSVGISTKEEDSWKIISGVTVEQVYLRFTIDNPAVPGNIKTNLAIGGILDLGQNSQFEISALYPNFVLNAYLTEGHVIHLNNLINYFKMGDLPKPGDMPNFDITVLAIQIDAKQKSLYFDGKIESNWQLIPGVPSAESLELELNSQRSSKGTITTGFLASDMKIGDENGAVELSLVAEFGESLFFQGYWSNPDDLSLGTLLEYLSKSFTIENHSVPTILKDLAIADISASFDTGTKDFAFSIETKFTIDQTELDAVISIELTHNDGKYTRRFSGIVKINDLQFALIFDTDETSKTFLAAYRDTNDTEISVKNLIGSISSTLKDEIPAGLTISLKDALFAYSKETQTNFLLGLDIGSGINLSKLPLVGKEFPPDQTIKLAYQVLVTKADFSQTEIVHLNTLYPEGGISLPEKSLTNRLDLATSMRLGNETRQLSLPIAINQNSGQLEENSQPESTAPSSADTTSPDGTKWYQLQKSFGPAHFERIGLKYQDQKIWFLLDVALSAAGLTVSLDGLSANSPLTEFKPEFNLKGIGIDYQSGSALEIGGAFLRKPATKDKPYDEYDGAAVIKSESFTLSAIGSYAQYDGHPSLFIYAVLDKPLGGPSFFFVTGLAAGFGYNRALKIPTIDQVVTFPLVEEAINSNQINQSSNTQDGATKLTQELNKLQQYIPPETGQTFLAVGVKFTSFQTIDSFALLTVAFGKRFELNLLGLSTLIAPPQAGKTPVAEVQLALKATFLPEEGFLGVRAQLTPNSYILSKKCHLTGGFAFYSWFAPHEHDGDFVLTLGGYHPKFNVPAHYPRVPRLAFNWQVNSELNIKADGYFALTAAALMAGGHLQATWHSGHLKAWFHAGADFLIAWKPYHYDASIYVDMGVSYTWTDLWTHHISVDVGADLHIWGPEFTGKAHIHLWIVSFTVSFGASASQTPQAIDWTTFKDSFLPVDSDICSVAVKDGLVRKVNQEDKSDLGVINPKHFCLVTNSVIPATQAKIAEGNTTDIRTIYYENEKYTQIKPFTKIDNQFQQETSAYSREISAPGIGSMEVRSADLTSTITITITKDKDPVEKYFAYIPILKKAPTGLWGESLTPDLNGERFIENTLAGFEIKPKKQPDPGETHPIDRQNLKFTTEPVKNAYEWEDIGAFQEKSGEDISSTIIKDSVKQAREDLLKAMNLDLDSREIDLSETIADHFLLSPKIGALATK
ncbi:MAG: hypothetical protein F6K55_15330 [Moorea sp. SIO4A3]|nr:hypothetical protein [Moorena sp. SIO4A3]